MGRGVILKRAHIYSPSSTRFPAREGGWSLIELTLTLFLLMGIALFGLKTMVSGFILQNWSIGQSMTDAYAGIETAYAQRYVFADILNGPNNGSTGSSRWGVYPAGKPATVTIGYMPSLSIPPTAATANAVTATVIRTYESFADPVTGASSYLLESYVVYQSGQRKYCKVSKVFRNQ
jgi:hypothetical protein